jgi:alpha-glucosidase
MQNYRDFTTDSIGFDISDGQAFLSQIHAKGLHYIPIFDSAIYIPNPMNASDAYATFERGNATDSFILNPDGSLYIGDVWPGFTVFPDWIGSTLNGTGAGDWWIDEVTRFHSDISFDGIWIDMSGKLDYNFDATTPANFYDRGIQFLCWIMRIWK